jgi:thioredoxin-related protein
VKRHLYIVLDRFKMNKLFLPGLVILFSSFINWQLDLNEAMHQSVANHKNVLLTFSGSDWCGPCKRMEEEIFNTKAFMGFADTSLILVNADFPRNKKNQLSPAQQVINNETADKYNPGGIFPFTLLLDEKGNILKSWQGFPKITTEEFIAEIKPYLHANP